MDLRSPRLYLLLVSIAALATPIAPASAAAPAVAPAVYGGLHWRLLGPFRGGWATMAAGVPGAPNTYYFGAADGGVWKSTDAGRTWRPLMQHEQAASVGAIAVAPSDPRVIYVGTGQVAARYDIAGGDGVYRSGDGGAKWQHIGLDNTQHIGRILVDPRDANRVLVAALGHIFGPNPERGVFVTTDGGRHWKKTLYVNANTGAVDLASDPTDPSVIYAATWQMRMHPWLDYFVPQAGPGSGIWKSTDGGETWHELRGHGLPGGPLGRIGLAVARGSNGRIVYATIAVPSGTPGVDNMATGGGSGIYRSENGGASWRLVNDSMGLASSYFGRLVVAPDHPNTLYVMGRSIRKSTDGGKRFTIFKGAPGGDDYHFLWINPDHPDHMITAADQGCVVTVNGGRSWSSWYNQPTGQFYHIATDYRFPYWVYGGQQDSGTVAIENRGPNGIIAEREWHPVGGDERDFDIPKPGDPNLVFGSGLGGYLSRFNGTTHQVTDVSPWPVSSYGADPRKVKYRYTWITPIAFGGGHPATLYFGAQMLFASHDDGASWRIVSPDLSGARQDSAACTAKSPAREAAKVCGFGVIYSIAPSPRDPKTIWVGTDDGEIERTTDAGKHWHNVTPKGMPLWGRVDAIALSPFVAGMAYAAVDVHRLDRSYPLIFRTTNGGRSWDKIVAGLPAGEYVTSVALDTVDKALVFAATNRSVFVSFNSGGDWQPLGLNLPTTSVRDLLVHGNDLVAGTMGRGIWSLDDIEVLREASAAIAKEPVHLFLPATAIRLRDDHNADTPPPPSEPHAINPPTGAIIDYYLGRHPNGPVTLTITDSRGTVVRTFSSAVPPRHLPADRYFERGWLGRADTLETGPGMHRFLWNLRWPRPAAIAYHYSIAAVWKRRTPLLPQGPLVLPGNYTVTLTAGGVRQSRPLTVKMDPRVSTSPQALADQLAFARSISASLDQAVSAYRKSGDYLAALKKNGGTPDRIAAVVSLRNGSRDSLRRVAGVLDSLAARLEQADAAPTSGQRAVFAAYKKMLGVLLARWQQMQSAASF